jgi:hypothetical protein
MATVGAPLGSKNAAKSRLFEQTLKRAITQDDGVRLRKAAETLLDMAVAGEGWAMNMLADRLDGKPQQAVVLSQDEDNPLFDTLKTSEELRKKMRGIVAAALPEQLIESEAEPGISMTTQEQVEPE